MNLHFRIFDKSDNKFIPINIDDYTVSYQGDCLLLSPASKWMKYFPFVNILDNENFVIQHNTGLKDKNGKEIYEGDIVKHPNAKFPNQIKWKQDYNGWKIVDKDGRCSAGKLTSEFEVLGNIFENPVLLK